MKKDYKKLLKNRKGDELIETLIAFPVFIIFVFVLIGSMQTFMANNNLEKVMNEQIRQATSSAYWINSDYASTKKIDPNSAYGKLFLFGEDGKGFLSSEYQILDITLYQEITSGSSIGEFTKKSWTNFSDEDSIQRTLSEMNTYFLYKDANGEYSRWRIGNKLEVTVSTQINSSLNSDLIESFSTIRFPGAKENFQLLDLTPKITVTMTIENDSNGEVL